MDLTHIDSVFDDIQTLLGKARNYPQFRALANELETELFAAHDQFMVELAIQKPASARDIVEGPGLRRFDAVYRETRELGLKLERALRDGI